MQGAYATEMLTYDHGSSNVALFTDKISILSTFTLQAYLCVQTTMLHEYLSATFTSPYHMHNSTLRSNQVHVVNISAPRSNLHISRITQRCAHISTPHVYKNVTIVN